MSGKDGLLLLKKPAGTTSFSALNLIKKKIGTGKVGHTGTLDKFAEGLLVVLTGKFTRLAPLISGMDKIYRAVFEFGAETSTLDPEGEMVNTGKVPTLEEIRGNKFRFTGSILQKPPAFSAIHINGKRAYERVLKGEQVDLPARPVSIHELEILDYMPPFLTVSVSCSKGTYIRSLARDYGAACGTCAYVRELNRTSVGPFSIADAVTAEEFDPETSLRRSRTVLENLFPHRSLVVRDSCRDVIRTGKPIRDEFFTDFPAENGIYLVFTSNAELAGLIEKRDRDYSYRFVCV